MPHRIFFVQDLIILITQELLEDWYKRDAVSLALTCRALESPVLSVLWARQTMLSTLVRVLPPKILAYTVHKRSKGPMGDELVRDSNFPSGRTS